MSSAPRPQTSPLRSSPENGATCHSAASASTTSVCDRSISVGPPRPGIRATRFARSGTFAYSSHATPFASRYPRSSSAAGVSFPGGLVVSIRISSCRSRVTSSRRLSAPSRPRRPSSVALLRERRQAVPHLPEIRIEAFVDQAAEHLDRSALRSDDLVADDPRDDLVVPDAPRCDALVPLEQRFRELIELLVLATADVELVDREPCRGKRCLEGIAQRRRDTANLPKAGRI